MRLAFFRASGWRNLRPLELSPGDGLNVICGDNAQGKTNLLEGIFYVASLRSFRTRRLAELITWGAPRASVQASVEYGAIQSRLGVTVERNRRSLELDGASVARAKEYFVGFCVVLFTPEHLSLVRGDASHRRQFLDRALFELDRGHLTIVRRYEAVLRQRNACLKRYGENRRMGETILDTLDIQLSQSARELVHRRRWFVEQLVPLARQVHASVAGNDGLQLAYQARGQGESSAYETWLLQALGAGRGEDFRRGYTRHGPHRDDLVISLQGRPAVRVASQGEARSIVLALKLAEASLLRVHHGEPPVLLLDDLGSELDARRRAVLFDRIGEMGAQSFITTVDASLIPGDSTTRVCFLRGGALEDLGG